MISQAARKGQSTYGYLDDSSVVVLFGECVCGKHERESPEDSLLQVVQWGRGMTWERVTRPNRRIHVIEKTPPGRLSPCPILGDRLFPFFQNAKIGNVFPVPQFQSQAPRQVHDGPARGKRLV